MKIIIIFFIIVLLNVCNINAEQLSANNNLKLTKIQKQDTHFTVKVGDTISLPCNIENRMRSTVIWQFTKSRRPPETLTIGFLQYRQDYRIRVVTNLTSEELESWDLEIRKVKIEDEGSYVCRVMTDSGTLKRQVHLKVEVSMLISPEDPVVNSKEALIIHCNTSYVQSYDDLNKPNNNIGIEWYKNNELHPLYFNYNTNGSNYKIEYSWIPTLSSRLKIIHVKPTNIATYICKFRSQNVSTTLRKSNSFTNRKNLKITNSAPCVQNKSKINILLAILSTVVIFDVYS